MSVTAIVLAAGGSARFGEDKLKIGFDGRSLLAIMLEKLRGVDFDETLLVSGDEELLRLGEVFGVRGVAHTGGHLGQSASIKAGVSAAKPGNDYMFFVGDQPLLRRQSITTLLECQTRYKNSAIIPVFGAKSGNPVIFPASLRLSLLALYGDQGGKSVLKSHKDTIYCHFSDEREGLDIDTRQDYERLLVIGSRTVVVRGGGDIATGVVQKLKQGGFCPVILETSSPTSIRRSVALSQAVYEGSAVVEDVRARLINDVSEIRDCFAQDTVPVLIDDNAELVSRIGPIAIVDAIIAKRNIGTHRGLAPITIGLGPGFTAGDDVDVVVETMRGHNLGRLIYSGSAQPNTGVPGEVGGVSALRVVHSPAGGKLCIIRDIGEAVSFGDTLAYVGSVPIIAPISGLLRGMISDGLFVRKGQKIADIDPRASESGNWRTISDKSRAIGGAVLAALLYEKQSRMED